MESYTDAFREALSMRTSSCARGASAMRMLLVCWGIAFLCTLNGIAASAVECQVEVDSVPLTEESEASLDPAADDPPPARVIIANLIRAREEWKGVTAAREQLKRRTRAVMLLDDLSFLPRQVQIHEELGPLQRDDMQLICKLEHVHTIHVFRATDESKRRSDFLFDDTSLASLAALPQLKSITCSDTDLTDESFKQLAKIETLEKITVIQSETSFTGVNFSHLAKLKRLKSLKIDCHAINMGRLEELQSELPDCKIEVKRTLKVEPMGPETVDEAQERLRRAIEGS